MHFHVPDSPVMHVCVRVCVCACVEKECQSYNKATEFCLSNSASPLRIAELFLSSTEKVKKCEKDKETKNKNKHSFLCVLSFSWCVCVGGSCNYIKATDVSTWKRPCTVHNLNTQNQTTCKIILVGQKEKWDGLTSNLSLGMNDGPWSIQEKDKDFSLLVSVPLIKVFVKCSRVSLFNILTENCNSPFGHISIWELEKSAEISLGNRTL